MSKPEKDRTREDLLDILRLILEGIGRVPGLEDIKRELRSLIELLGGGRAPRILLVGRSGAGKSSLVNAIYGQYVAEVGSVRPQSRGEWYTFRDPQRKRALEVLDARGASESVAPTGAEPVDPVHALNSQLRQRVPDLALYLVRAHNVRNYVEEDATFVEAARKLVQSVTRHQMPVLPILTRVDELDPVGAPLDDEEKGQNITEALELLERAFHSRGLTFPRAVPVVTRLDFHKEQGASGTWEVAVPNRITYDGRVNISNVVEMVYERLPDDAKLAMAGLTDTKEIRLRFAERLVEVSRNIAAGLAAIPIPLVDVIPVAAVQLTMICGIAYIGGRDVDVKLIPEFLVVLGVTGGGSFLFRELGRELAKLLPSSVAPWINAGLAAGSTVALGRAAMAYFVEGKTADDVRAQFTRETQSLREGT